VTWIFNLSPSIYLVYNFQHFEPIRCVNGLFRSLPTFQVIDFKVNIDLDDFPSLSESMMQQPPIQLLQLTTFFYWNENFDFALMDILKEIGIHHWSMLFHCSTFFVRQILLK